MLTDAGQIEGFEQTLETHLLADLRAQNTQAKNGSIAFAVHDSDASLIGGLSGATSYGWLLVKMVWVAPDHRGQGWAKSLLANAYDQARARGCHSAWLDTSSPASLVIWQRLGFTEFGRLKNEADQFPEGHRRWFLKRALP